MALIALGAILAFAVRDSLGGVDLVAVGYILMLAGLVGAVLGLAALNRTSSGFSTTSRRTVVDGQQAPRQEVVEQDVR